MLGFGLCAVAYRTRWFAPACGLAATFKLTALGLWPLVFWHGFGQSHYARILGLAIAIAVWVALTPASWFFGGPAYLGVMLVDRYVEYSGQCATYGGAAGLFLPTRYWWPLGLLALLTVTSAVARSSLDFGAARRFGPRIAMAMEDWCTYGRR